MFSSATPPLRTKFRALPSNKGHSSCLGDSMLDREMAFTQLSRASNDSKLYAAEAQYGESLVLLAKRMAKSN